MNGKALVVTVLVIVGMLGAPLLFAEEKEFKIQDSDTIRTLLQQHTGERLILGLDSGAEIVGIVTKVGDHVVHVSKPAGKEFYDAVISLDKIASFMIRVRGK